MIYFRGNTPETKGMAFVVYEDIFNAKNACDHLSGFNVCNQYLIILYYLSNKVSILFNVFAIQMDFAAWCDKKSLNTCG